MANEDRSVAVEREGAAGRSGGDDTLTQEELKDLRKLTGWRIDALDRLTGLELDLKQIESAVPKQGLLAQEADSRDAKYREALRCVKDARLQAGQVGKHRFRAMLFGSDVEGVWLKLHRAQVLLVELTPDEEKYRSVLIDAQARARRRLKADDVRLVELDKVAQASSITEGDMAKAAVALRAAYAISGEEKRQLRSFRNILAATFFITFVIAIVLAVVGWLAPQAVPLCWGSGEERQCPLGGEPTSADVAVIEMYGILGAAVTGALAIRRIRGTSTPYAIPLWSIVLKLPIGALTAVLALLLVQLVDSFTITSQPAIAAWAVVFGVSQESFTRLIDRQAQTILDRIPTQNKNDPSAAAAGGSAGSPANV